ncbi:MAG: alcohol dehydrogenase catalytic domain-containing protein [Christensenellaceae bacterium]|jgi:NADPH:quinone reductase-like Zn-dependent oxidoreductase|nr:alcohol dehydrogenase catalytic domain-containing protein [Christensenellaceae bacterium]
MRAAIYTRYGPPEGIRLAKLPRPAPGPGEVLVKVHAASLGAYDWHRLRAKPFPVRASAGLLRPKNQILGADIAGEVAALGEGASDFRVGDRVYGCLESCGKGGGLAAWPNTPARKRAFWP